MRCKCVHVTSDFPERAIVAAARKEGCDLIAMASRGRRGLARWMLGSQTQKALAQFPVPALVHR